MYHLFIFKKYRLNNNKIDTEEMQKTDLVNAQL